jgi:hypothetical protein
MRGARRSSDCRVGATQVNWNVSASLARKLIKNGELEITLHRRKLTRISPAAVIAYETKNVVVPTQ